MHDKRYGDSVDDPKKENQCDDVLRKHARNLPLESVAGMIRPNHCQVKLYATQLRCVFDPVFYIQPLLRGDGARSNPPSWLH